jgi:predicted deacetylase
VEGSTLVSDVAHAKRLLIVTLHDVAPPFETEIRDQLERLSKSGVQPRVLEVVPNWHGSQPITRYPSLVELLHAEQAAGSQIVLHGWEHRSHGQLRGAPWTRLRGALFARDAAEFLTLLPEEAEQAVTQGLDALEAVGLGRPGTFCAPGWLMTEEAAGAIGRCGMRYIVDMFGVRDLQTLRRYRLPAIGYMGAHEAGIQILNAIIRQTVGRQAKALQVYLHPQSGKRSARDRILEEIADMVGRGGWVPTTYDALETISWAL